MQALTTPQPAAASSRKVFAAATALLIAGAVLAYSLPRSASAAAADSVASFHSPAGLMHDGVDWSRVDAKPVDAGATVGAYER